MVIMAVNLIDTDIKKYNYKFKPDYDTDPLKYKEYGIKNHIRNFVEYYCILPNITNISGFNLRYLKWFLETNNSPGVILIQKRNDRWLVSTNSRHPGFHKFLISGILIVLGELKENVDITHQQDEILEQIPEEYREYIKKEDIIMMEKGIKSPEVFEYYLKDYEKREIINMIVENTNIKNIIYLFRTYRDKYPKMSFISFHIKNGKDDQNYIYNISTNWLEEDDTTFKNKMKFFIHRLCNDSNELFDFDISISTIKDPPIKILVKQNTELYNYVSFQKYDLPIKCWVQLLFAIGSFGIRKFYDFGYLDTIIEKTIEFVDEHQTSDNYQITNLVKRLYKFALLEPVLSKADCKVYFNVIARSTNDNNTMLYLRANFCIFAERLLCQMKGNYSDDEKSKMIIKFRDHYNNKFFFSDEQKENDLSYQYVQRILDI